MEQGTLAIKISLCLRVHVEAQKPEIKKSSHNKENHMREFTWFGDVPTSTTQEITLYLALLD